MIMVIGLSPSSLSVAAAETLRTRWMSVRKGGKSFSMATKCSSTEAALSRLPKRVSATAVASPATAGSGMSYSSALSR